MPEIIPIKDLKKTSEVSALCHRTSGPVFITKNGYGDMVLMSMETYEKTMYMQDIFAKLDEAEKGLADGKTLDAREALRELRMKHGI